MRSLHFNDIGYLFPSQVLEVDLEFFEEIFVRRIERSETRKSLFDAYLHYTYRFQDEVFPQFEQWIDGSFTTLKDNPKDLDVVTFLDYRVFDFRQERTLDKYLSFSLEKEGIDAYLVKEYPVGHKNYPLFLSEQRLWYNRFSSDNRGVHKGFLKIIFSK
jgi:hypothetical protein